jgi:transposase
MEVIVERSAALAVHKAQVTACVRVPGPGRERDAVSQGADQGAPTRGQPPAQGAREDTGIKLDCVATDILGVSGRAMLDALVAGTTDPELLADLARGKLRKKLPALEEALEGRFDELHALLIGSILAHLDFLDEQIERLSDAIEAQLRPFQPAVELLRSLDGIETRTAQNILAEIGIDMSVFPSDRQLASWAGQCPDNDQSAGKRRTVTLQEAA